MDKITEVGHKMRSAIKAKLIELGCYVDDELPDYVMVMVANHRSKEMMTEDLQLFLDDNTEVFVNWLHQVLQKLHEVTVNNIDIPKIAKQEARLTRKIVESKSSTTKSVKKEKDKPKSNSKTPPPVISTKKERVESQKNSTTSITDEIPVSAKTIVERRITMKQKSLAIEQQDQFDIPSVSEVDKLELAEIETKIEAAKRKLAQLETEIEDSGDFINIKADDEFFEFGDDSVCPPSTSAKSPRTPPRRISLRPANDIEDSGSTPPKPPPTSTTRTKISVLDRLGERHNTNIPTASPVRKKIRLSEIKRVEEEILNSSRSRKDQIKKDETLNVKKTSVHDRIGLMSRVIPVNKTSTNRKRSHSRSCSPPLPLNSSLSSVVQVKPRKMPPKSAQPNKNLLLKAVAEAQKSVTALNIDSNKEKINNNNDDENRSSHKKELFTSHYKKNRSLAKETIKNIVIKVQSDNAAKELNSNKVDLSVTTSTNSVRSRLKPAINQQVVDDQELEDNDDILEYSSSNLDLQENNDSADDEEFDSTKRQKQRFIVTLNGVDENIFKSKNSTISTKLTSDNDKKDKESLLMETTEEIEKDNSIETKDNDLQDKQIEMDTSLDTVDKTDSNKMKSKRNPSPITFDKRELESNDDGKLPVLPLPKVYPVLPLKVKERCKYWPGCRLGDTCEYVHPAQQCKMFPLCKFGDRCLYIHPPCKFDVACSRRGCPYMHTYTVKTSPKLPTIASTVVPVLHHSVIDSTTLSSGALQQICKYFPNCSNIQCPFYHPKQCRFGKYCNNKSECNFCHTKDVPAKEKLKWKSK